MFATFLWTLRILWFTSPRFGKVRQDVLCTKVAAPEAGVEEDHEIPMPTIPQSPEYSALALGLVIGIGKMKIEHLLGNI